MKTKPHKMSKRRKSRSRIPRASKVRIDVTSEGWKAYPKNRQEYTQLIPLITIAEAFGLEVHIVDRESKSKPSSANA